MPAFGDIMAARKALDGYTYETPVIYSNALQGRTGHQQVALKCENLQRTGSCHLRGMLYAVVRAKEDDLGVNHFVTHSTGNRGAALACAAMQFQSTAHVVVPEGTSELITSSIRHYKGHYYYSKPTVASRTAVAQQLLARYSRDEDGRHNQAVFVHPYDDPHIIAGLGTTGVEFMLQMDCHLDCIIVPVNGGALLAGVAMAVKGMKPHVAVYAAEPTAPDNTYQPFKRGELPSTSAPTGSSNNGSNGNNNSTDDNNSNAANNNNGDGHGSNGNGSNGKRRKMGPYNAQSNTYGLLTPLPPRVAKYIDTYVDGVIRVSNDEVRYAFRFLYERCKLVVDTNAAIAVAALLACRPELQRYRCVGVVLPGGNIDLNKIPKLAVARL